jgi:hypothetical protein
MSEAAISAPPDTATVVIDPGIGLPAERIETELTDAHDDAIRVHEADVERWRWLIGNETDHGYGTHRHTPRVIYALSGPFPVGAECDGLSR